MKQKSLHLLKIILSTALGLVFLLCLLSTCKKKGDEVTQELIEGKLTGENGVQTWIVPFALSSCSGNLEVERRLTFRSDRSYTYVESGCTEEEGHWEVQRFANRAGQHIRIEFHSPEGGFTPLELKYDRASGTFFYLHNQKGLMPLVPLSLDDRYVWENRGDIDVYPLLGRVNMVSVQLNNEVYVGMGQSGASYPTDWYRFWFDGGKFLLEGMPSSPVGFDMASTCAYGDSIYVLGGNNNGVSAFNSVAYSIQNKDWNYLYNVSATSIRNNTSFVMNNYMITGLGAGNTGLHKRNILDHNFSFWDYIGTIILQNAPTAPPLFELQNTVVVPWGNGRVLVGGGRDDNNNFSSNEFVVFSNVSSTSIQMDAFPHNLSFPFSEGMAVVHNGKILMYGVKNGDNNNYDNKLHVFEEGRGWYSPSASGEMPQANQSTVFWKVGGRIFAGLGANGQGLYELRIEQQ